MRGRRGRDSTSNDRPTRNCPQPGYERRLSERDSKTRPHASSSPHRQTSESDVSPFDAEARRRSRLPHACSAGLRKGWSTRTTKSFLGIPTMINAARRTEVATPRSTLRLHQPSADVAGSTRWLINGFPAIVLVWTAEEWARLSDHPEDAQLCANGTRCALRMGVIPVSLARLLGSSVKRPATPPPMS